MINEDREMLNRYRITLASIYSDDQLALMLTRAGFAVTGVETVGTEAPAEKIAEKTAAQPKSMVKAALALAEDRRRKYTASQMHTPEAKAKAVVSRMKASARRSNIVIRRIAEILVEKQDLDMPATHVTSMINSRRADNKRLSVVRVRGFMDAARSLVTQPSMI